MTDANEDYRRFDESQFALILKQAAEMQERDPSAAPGAGLTLREMEVIAAEAGIQPHYVRQAVASITRHGHESSGNPIGFARNACCR